MVIACGECLVKSVRMDVVDSGALGDAATCV